MAEPTPTDRVRLRRPALMAAVAIGGLVAITWWRQARRDPALVARTRARLAGVGPGAGGMANPGARVPDVKPSEAPAPGTVHVGTPGGPAPDAPPINAFLANSRPESVQANHHYPPDLSGLKAG